MFSCIRSSFKSHQIFLKESSQSNLIPSLGQDVVETVVSDLNIKYRKRRFDPYTTLLMFVGQILDTGSSCQRAVTLFLIKLNLANEKLCSSATAAYCKAKKRLPIIFFEKISYYILGLCCENLPQEWLFKGSHVKVVDGSCFSLPDTKDNRASFPMKTSSSKFNGFPTTRAVFIFSLSTGAVINFILSSLWGKGTGETSGLMKMWKHFKPGDTLLGDALFGCYPVVASAMMRGIQVVTEIKKDMVEKLLHGRQDLLVTFTKPKRTPLCMSTEDYAKLPEGIKVRIITLLIAPRGYRVQKKYILTTYIDSSIVSLQDIAELYRQRWKAETNLRSLKEYMGMESMSCKSVDMIYKEFWTYIISYNLIRLQMIVTAQHLALLPDQISFTATKSFLEQYRNYTELMNGASSINWNILLIHLLSNNLVGKRPNRYEPRALKKREQTKYGYLTGSRLEAKTKLWKLH